MAFLFGQKAQHDVRWNTTGGIVAEVRKTAKRLTRRGKFTMFNGMKRTEYGYVCSTEQAIIEKLSREEKHMQAIIYTKQNCQKCRLTVSELSQVMPVQTITADNDDYERFRKLGYRSMPVVTIYKAYGKHDEWCDLRFDKIKQYTNKYGRCGDM